MRSDMLMSILVKLNASSMSRPASSMTSAKSRSISGLENWKWPLSVTIPPARARPMSLSMGAPFSLMTRRTTCVQAVLVRSHRNM